MIDYVRELLKDPAGFERRESELMRDRKYAGTDEVHFKDGRVFERYSQPQTVRGEVVGRVCSFRDVTKRRVAEEGLRRLTSELEDRVRERTAALASSNEELESFAYAASHDLSAPLRRITAFSELLLQQLGPKLTDSERELLVPIHLAAVRLTKLVSDVLELSRVGRDSLPLEPVDLNAVMEEVNEDLTPLIYRSGANVSCGKLPTIRAHPTLIRRLLQNLVENALKYARKDVPPRVEVSGETAPDGSVKLSVKDNGIGFEAELADELFKPFRRLHSQAEYEGSGIGLAICRRIAGRYGAEIRAEGGAGKGATFVIVFPPPKARGDGKLSSS
jgi:light-regulated signal transduction histidine kinase (bacteriophytochrome)